MSAPCRIRRLTSHSTRAFTTLTHTLTHSHTHSLPAHITAAHTHACAIKKNFYIDPDTGYKVMTEYAHQKRGVCCGKECRHCAFDHVNVPKEFDE
jgi:hypothetical protein